MSIEQVLISAINNKSSLEVFYKGHLRRISPVRFGRKTTEKDGLHKNLMCYQFSGYSSRGLKPDGSMENYRCWNLEDITTALLNHSAGWGIHDWSMSARAIVLLIRRPPR